MRLASLFVRIAVAALCVGSLVGCGAETSSPEEGDEDFVVADGEENELKTKVLGERDNGKTISITTGDSFTIALPNNASTGFAWRLKSVDKTLSTPTVSTTASDPSRPGSGGMKRFTWKTKSPLKLEGRHTIVLEHSRSFEKNGQTKLFTLTVDIKDPAKK